MANRRMFSRSVTGSGRFLRLSAPARALYYDLGMEADDDGFVEAFVRLRATGAEEVHLGELEQAGLIAILDRENLVVSIRDWTVNNAVRKDRYTPSVYRSVYPWCLGPEPQPEPKTEQPAPLPEAPVFCEMPVEDAAGEPLERQEAPGEPHDNQMATTGVFLSDSVATQVRLGKDRVGKERVEQVNSVQSIIGQNREEKVYKEGGDFEHARGKNALSKPLFQIQEKPNDSFRNRNVFPDYGEKSKLFSSCQSRASPACM